jgi:sugar O-acyltransferase (sialic acid O-acetyltransferase NeuD family)
MKIYLFGASNPETIRMIQAVENSSPDFQVAGFLDNDKSKHGKNFFGYDIIGGQKCVNQLINPDVRFVNLITGDILSRHYITNDIINSGGLMTNFIHPSVNLSMVDVGLGIYIQESVIVQASAKLCNNCSIHIGALVAHESVIGESTFIAHAASISGCCEVGSCCFIGTNSTILPRIKIGNYVTIGAGCVVINDIPDYAVVVGNPGKIIRYNKF